MKKREVEFSSVDDLPDDQLPADYVKFGSEEGQFEVEGKFEMRIDCDGLSLELAPKKLPPAFFKYFKRKDSLNLMNPIFVVNDDGLMIVTADFRRRVKQVER